MTHRIVDKEGSPVTQPVEYLNDPSNHVVNFRQYLSGVGLTKDKRRLSSIRERIQFQNHRYKCVPLN